MPSESSIINNSNPAMAARMYTTTIQADVPPVDVRTSCPSLNWRRICAAESAGLCPVPVHRMRGLSTGERMTRP